MSVFIAICRQSDEAEQQRVMGMLHEIEAAALATNKEAGHPELHRGADSVDYLDGGSTSKAAQAV